MQEKDDGEDETGLPRVISANRTVSTLQFADPPCGERGDGQNSPHIVAAPLQDQQYDSPHGREEHIRSRSLVVQPDTKTRVELADAQSSPFLREPAAASSLVSSPRAAGGILIIAIVAVRV